MKNNCFKQLKIPVYLVSILILFAGCQLSDQPDSASYSIVYSAKELDKRAIYLSDEDGKSRMKVTDVTSHDGYPSVSSDGKRLAFYGKYDDRKTWSIHTVDIDGSNVQRLTHVEHVWDSAPSWSPDGKTIVFAREYDDPTNGWQEEIWMMNEDGGEQRQIEALEGRAPYFMQDARILFHSKKEPSQIRIANTDGSDIVQLTDNDANNWSPKVSPDGTQIIFISDRDGNREIYTMMVDGSDQTRITFNEVDDWDPAWSVDGSKVFFASENTDGDLDIYKAKKDGSAMEKILDNGLQVSTVLNLDNNAFERLKSARQ